MLEDALEGLLKFCFVTIVVCAAIAITGAVVYWSFLAVSHVIRAAVAALS